MGGANARFAPPPADAHDGTADAYPQVCYSKYFFVVALSFRIFPQVYHIYLNNIVQSKTKISYLVQIFLDGNFQSDISFPFRPFSVSGESTDKVFILMKKLPTMLVRHFVVVET